MPMSIVKPTPDLLTPKVQALVGEILAEANREDSTPIEEYIEMIQTSPIIGPAIELKVLMGLNLLGDYSNTGEDYQAHIRKCLEQMRGSLKLAVAELLCVQPLGFACSEWAPIDHDGKWMLDSIQLIDPRKYRFRGRRGLIEDVLYTGDTGDIAVPYDRVIHLVNQTHISFGSPYGVAECRRALSAYKAWKITIAAALIAAKRRGEPITVGYADPVAQVEIGKDIDGQPILISAPDALLRTLQDLENNSVAATSIANKIETLQAADGKLILDVLQVLQQLQLMAFLVPESILSATGVGDSNLNTGHRTILNLCVGAAIDQIKERLVEDVVRPLLVWEFGEEVQDFGAFPTPKAQEEGAIDLFNALINAVYNGAFSAADLDVINRMRELAGLPTVREIAQKLDGAPTDAGDEEEVASIDDVAAQFAAAKKAPKGKKKGKGQKNCDKGLNCGGTCISAKKKCRKDNPSPSEKKKLKPGKGKGGGGSGGGESKPKPDQVGESLIPAQDPYKKELSVFNSIGKELSYDGVKQNTPNSRIFGARDEAKYFKSYDEDTQAGWLQDHLAQFAGVKNEGSKAYADRAAYELNLIWSKASDGARRKTIKQWGDTKDPIIRSVFGDDLVKLAETKPDPKPKVKKKKSTKGDDPIGDALDSLFEIDAAATQFAAAKKAPKGKKKGKGQKNCEKGLNCGGTCISAKKKCKKDNPAPGEKKKLKPGKGKGGGGGGSIDSTDIEKITPPIGGVDLDYKQLDKHIEAAIKHRGTVSDIIKKTIPITNRLESDEVLPDKVRIALAEEQQSLFSQLKKANARKFAALDSADKLMSDYRQKLISSGMSKADAEKLADKVRLDEKLDESTPGRDKVRANLVEFHQLTNGAIAKNIEEIGYTGNRANANIHSKFINAGLAFGDTDLKSTLFHEFAHLTETFDMMKNNQAWMLKRATSSDLSKMDDLVQNKLTRGTADPRGRYEDNEVAIKDEFYNPYVGRFYGDKYDYDIAKRSPGVFVRPTEVMSMGFEKFVNPTEMLDLYMRDKAHFDVIKKYLDTTRNV